MTSRDETAVRQKSHARYFWLGGALHDCRHMHVLRVPQSDRVVETARYDLGVIRDPLPVLLTQALRVEWDDLEDRALVAWDVRLLLATLDTEDADAEIRMDEEIARGVCHYNFNLLDFFFLDELLMDKGLFHVDV